MSDYDFLLSAVVDPADTFRFGVITAGAPLRVKLDGDTAAASITPIATCVTAVGDRVLIQIHNRQLIIIARVLPAAEAGIFTAEKIRLSSTGDASASSTTHAFQIGPDNGQNLIIDGNEIMARNNGVGGQVYFEFGVTSGAQPSDDGSLTRKDFVIKRVATGNTIITPSAANTPTSKAITFPAGQFTNAPTLMITLSSTVPGTTVTGIGTSSVTNTGALLWVTRTNTTNTSINWAAFSSD